MRNLILHICLIFSILAGFGQNPIVFNKVYDNDLKNDALDDLLETDSYFISGGVTNYGPGLSYGSRILYRRTGVHS
ncbi:MAG: hypothetical protein ACI9O4_000252 [Chitinophagales bacterium]|jgi:hypothetical protein